MKQKIISILKNIILLKPETREQILANLDRAPTDFLKKTYQQLQNILEEQSQLLAKIQQKDPEFLKKLGMITNKHSQKKKKQQEELSQQKDSQLLTSLEKEMLLF